MCVCRSERHFTGFPVVEDGDLVGVVTREDVLSALHAERTGSGQ